MQCDYDLVQRPVAGTQDECQRTRMSSQVVYDSLSCMTCVSRYDDLVWALSVLFEERNDLVIEHLLRTMCPTDRIIDD